MLLEQCNSEHKHTQQYSTHLLQGCSDCSQLWIKAMDVIFPISHGLFSAPQFCFQWCYFLVLEAIRGHWCFFIFKVKVHYTTHSKIRYSVGKGDRKVYDHRKPGKVVPTESMANARAKKNEFTKNGDNPKFFILCWSDAGMKIII